MSESEFNKCLKRAVWDYDIPADQLVRIFKGQETLGWLERDKLFARILTTSPWYDVIDMLSSDELRMALQDNVLQFIWSQDVKSRFLSAREVLYGLR